jgi:serine/threonine-protein kinase
MPIGGFTPGTVIGARYRIIGLLGRGGMGEVYRADDLKLGQPVALKFLPESLAEDPVLRERFFAEVRIARQISHPNVCRVYDVAELEGQHCLSMEYIDGEDLGSLLTRIGRLPIDKALDISRQICAGLAAAHEKGVLHRDLKPSNIMLDGRGRARITDFGLAVVAEEASQENFVSGTPAYMAPEQLAGKGTSVRSDIYALGMVLYELYTGKRAFDAGSLAELRNKKENAAPTPPSQMVKEMDPVVERVILHCLDKDPRARPPSVLQVAAALPGADPLAAALAAGETPSPETVAASGSVEGLKPRLAWACLAVVLIGLIFAAQLNVKATLLGRVRRRWPATIVSWSRLLAGEVRDPLVGRDLLFGSAFGAAFSVIILSSGLLPSFCGRAPETPLFGLYGALTGGRNLVSGLRWIVTLTLFVSLAHLFLLFLLRTVLRKQWAAAAAYILILAPLRVLQSSVP